MRAYNGSPSKYVRLIRRNCAMPAPPHTMTTFAAPHDPERTHSMHVPRDADARDRVRSSWLPDENQCNALASDIPLPAHPGAPLLDYRLSMEAAKGRRYEGARIPLWLCACSSLSALWFACSLPSCDKRDKRPPMPPLNRS